MLKKSIVAATGVLALTAALDASAYTYTWNVNGTPGTSPTTNSGATIGLGPGGAGLQYHHMITGLAPGDVKSFTGADHAMFDAMNPGYGPGVDGPYAANWATNPTALGSGSYGVGIQAWCQGGACAQDVGAGFGWNHTSQHILFELTETQDVTLTVSGNATLAPAATGVGKYGLLAPHSGTGGLGTNLNPAFTVFSGKSIAGPNATNHTWVNDGSDPTAWPTQAGGVATGLTYLYHNGNDADGDLVADAADKTLTHTFTALPAGFYTVFVGGMADNPVVGGTSSKNYYFKIETAAATVVPVPAAVWLFGSALAGMGIIGRRKDKAAV